MTLSWLTTRLIPTLPTPFLGIGNKTMRSKIALETTLEGIKFKIYWGLRNMVVRKKKATKRITASEECEPKTFIFSGLTS